ncbi:PilZ domain-containing protein [bacterium]|nr:PilZ domain-containing protein [bacterium]
MDENRRNFSRVRFNSTVFLNYNGLHIESSLIDISLKGALVAPEELFEISKGDSCELEFHLNETDVILKINTMIVYLKGNNLGLKFINIDLESMIHLRRLVELNIGDPDKIQKELFFLASTDH